MSGGVGARENDPVPRKERPRETGGTSLRAPLFGTSLRDVRVGGKYTWRWKNVADGKEFGFFGVFREVDAPKRIAHTETFDPGDVGGEMGTSQVSTEFSETNGVTTLTTLIEFASRDARDAAVATGMTDGMEMGYERLDRICAEPAA